MARSAKQWASLMKRPSIPTNAKKHMFDDKLYDGTERKRKFIPHWRDSFPWVEYNSDEGKMFCMTCWKTALHADKSSALYVGSTRPNAHCM